MESFPLNSEKLHTDFLASSKPHILMISNHGLHEWQVVPGLPDTGGQNIFVNQFSQALADFGFRITIANRGGYMHPQTGKRQSGLRYMDHFQRILYLEDGRNEFVRKEDMHAQIPDLTKFLADFFAVETTPIDLIISHYWDGAGIGVRYNKELEKRVKQVWVPHSLGSLKKDQVDPEKWCELRLEERIAAEKDLIPELDFIAATSTVISKTLKNYYGYTTEVFLPPCIDTQRFRPQQVPASDGIWGYLSRLSGLSRSELQNAKIITEISRTDITKRKDILIKAFAKVQRQIPSALLVVSIDDTQANLAGKLKNLIHENNIKERTVVVGSISDILPGLLAVTDIYCTPSIMEGFGMSAQEAAASCVPVVASNLVPFAVEYLLGSDHKKIKYSKSGAITRGEGAIVVPPDDVSALAKALEILLADKTLRLEMGRKAYKATIPFFTWKNMVNRFLNTIGTGSPNE
jgi:mannosylfructose-phosphate synthase